MLLFCFDVINFATVNNCFFSKHIFTFFVVKKRNTPLFMKSVNFLKCKSHAEIPHLWDFLSHVNLFTECEMTSMENSLQSYIKRFFSWTWHVYSFSAMHSWILCLAMMLQVAWHGLERCHGQLTAINIHLVDRASFGVPEHDGFNDQQSN